MRITAVLVASVAVMAFAVLADHYLYAMWREGARNLDSSMASAATTLARFALVGFLVALAWTVVRIPRSLVVGAAMMLLGLYFALAPAYPALLGNTGIPLPPLTAAVLAGPAQLAVWGGTAIASLGVLHLVRPTRQGETPRPATAL